MSIAEIKGLLSALAYARALHDSALQTWPGQARLDAVLTEAEALSKERALYLEHYSEDVARLEASIKDRVLALRETVKGDALMAVWTKPRVSGDGKLLESFATAHPELLSFRHVGQPSVSIRPVRRDADA